MSKEIKMKFARASAILACGLLIFIGMTFMSKDTVVSLWIRLATSIAFVALAVAIWTIEKTANSADAPKKKSTKEGFDWSMHYFRAFAILTIMAMHYLGVFGYSMPVKVIFHSSTIFFLFISGYLCQFIDIKRRDQPLAYYRKKLLNVICPFVIFSILFGFLKGMFGLNLAFLKDLLLGRVQGQYWYIPFVSGLFLISPVLCRLSNKRLILVAMISYLLFCIFPFRPGGFMVSWPDTFYLYSYFTFFYVMGFVYCRYKSLFDKCINAYWPLVAVVALVTTILLAYAHNLKLALCGYDYIVGLQKLSFTALAIVCLGYLKDTKVWLLDQLAKYSFTLYFLHFGFFAQSHKFHDTLISLLPTPMFISELLVFCLYTTGLLTMSLVFKAALGRFSRPIIGS